MMTRKRPLNADKHHEVREQDARRDADGAGYQSIDRLAPLALLLILAVAYSQIIRLDVGALDAPGPGLWPTVVAVILAMLLVPLFFIGRDQPEPVSKMSVVKVAITLALFAAFPILYDLLGFIPTGALGAGIFAWYIGREKPLTSILLGVGSSIAVYLLFGVLLDLRVSPIG